MSCQCSLSPDEQKPLCCFSVSLGFYFYMQHVGNILWNKAVVVCYFKYSVSCFYWNPVCAYALGCNIGHSIHEVFPRKDWMEHFDHTRSFTLYQCVVNVGEIGVFCDPTRQNYSWLCVPCCMRTSALSQWKWLMSGHRGQSYFSKGRNAFLKHRTSTC